jgi:hypothetical protein
MIELIPTPSLKKEGLNLNLMQIAKLSEAPLFFKRWGGGEFTFSQR